MPPRAVVEGRFLCNCWTLSHRSNEILLVCPVKNMPAKAARSVLTIALVLSVGVCLSNGFFYYYV